MVGRVEALQTEFPVDLVVGLVPAAVDLVDAVAIPAGLPGGAVLVSVRVEEIKLKKLLY